MQSRVFRKSRSVMGRGLMADFSCSHLRSWNVLLGIRLYGNASQWSRLLPMGSLRLTGTADFGNPWIRYVKRIILSSYGRAEMHLGKYGRETRGTHSYM